jgi:hypothetical protein
VRDRLIEVRTLTTFSPLKYRNTNLDYANFTRLIHWLKTTWLMYVVESCSANSHFSTHYPSESSTNRVASILSIVTCESLKSIEENESQQFG